MIEDSLSKVKAGLRRGLWLFTLFLAASEALGFARFYVEFVFKSLPKPWIYGYLVVANVAVAGTIWYVAYRVNPRVLDFVQHLSVRLREADYVPWGTKKRGLLLVLDSKISSPFVSFLGRTVRSSCSPWRNGPRRSGYFGERSDAPS